MAAIEVDHFNVEQLGSIVRVTAAVKVTFTDSELAEWRAASTDQNPRSKVQFDGSFEIIDQGQDTQHPRPRTAIMSVPFSVPQPVAPATSATVNVSYSFNLGNQVTLTQITTPGSGGGGPHVKQVAAT